MDEFGARLRRYRIGRNMTQAELGLILGVSQETITNYERGLRFPRPATLKGIAQHLDLSLDALLGEAQDQREVPGLGQAEEPHDPSVPSVDGFLECLRFEGLERGSVYLGEWKAQTRLGLGEFFELSLIPTLTRLGLLWQSGKLSVAEEHFLSGRIRELAILVANAESREPPPSAPRSEKRWMGLCAPGESHELGIFLHSLVVRQAGWTTWFLGTNVPLSDLCSAIAACQPQVLGLSATLPDNCEGLVLYAQEVRARFGPRPAIIAGGSGFIRTGRGPSGAIDGVARSITEGLALAEGFA